MNVERMRKANARRREAAMWVGARAWAGVYIVNVAADREKWLTDPTWEAFTKALTRVKAAQDPDKVFAFWTTEEHALQDMTDEQRERYKAKWSAE